MKTNNHGQPQGVAPTKSGAKDNFTPHPDYHKLPESIKAVVGPKAYAWMGDAQRATLEEDFCNPEVPEDF